MPVPAGVVHGGRHRAGLGPDSGPAGHRHAGAGNPGGPGHTGLLAGLHEGRPPFRLVLRRPFPFCGGHAYPGAGGQLPVALRGLGAGGIGFLPADRVLVRETLRGRGGQEGFRHHAHRGRRPADRHPAAVQRGGHLRHVHHIRRGPGVGERRAQPSRKRDGNRRGPAALHRSDGQVGPVPLPRMASRRYGRPYARQRPYPRRNNGCGGRVSGGPGVPALRGRARRPDSGGRHRA